MDDENIGGNMARLQIIITLEVPDKAAATTKLQQLKSKVKGTGVKLSASYSDMLEKPTEQ